MKPKTKYKNWRIRPDLHKQIERASVDESVPMYALAEKAWRAYAHRGAEPPTPDPQVDDPAITPATATERELMAALLRFLRDSHVPATLRNVLSTLLEAWKDPPGDAKPNTRTA